MRLGLVIPVVVAVALAAVAAASAALIWNIPTSVIAEAQGPAGATVAYSVEVTTNSGHRIDVNCLPASGTTMPIGSTTVTCTVTDDDGTTDTRSFTVTVDDTLPPSLTPFDGRQVEADGPAGSHVSYDASSAVDLVDGPVPVACSPNSGGVFPLGATQVTCTAVDSRGNAATVAAEIRVVDTTPPTLNVPPPIAIQAAAGADSVAATEPAVAAFLAAPTAVDIVTSHPRITSNAPASFAIGTTSVTFTAIDDAGNIATETSSVTVGKTTPSAPATPSGPAPPTTSAQPSRADTTPPANVGRASAKSSSRRVELAWAKPPDRDFTRVTITRSRTDRPGVVTVVYDGDATRFTDTNVENGVEYRYVIVSVDGAGNRSAGIAITVRPRRQLLFFPANGARVKRAPVLVWAVVPSVGYYNVQVYRNGQKVLSAWPTDHRLFLRETWTYGGRSYTLGPGTYRWYVWPGIGQRSAAKYGPLLGSSTFVR
jgi:hypothetical protein